MGDVQQHESLQQSAGGVRQGFGKSVLRDRGSDAHAELATDGLESKRPYEVSYRTVAVIHGGVSCALLNDGDSFWPASIRQS